MTDWPHSREPGDRRAAPDWKGASGSQPQPKGQSTCPPRLADLLDERDAALLHCRGTLGPRPVQHAQRLRNDVGAQRRRADHPAFCWRPRGLICCAGCRARRMRLQAARNVVHFVSQICWTIAIMVLPFATVFALEFTHPAWVALLAVLFLGERMTLTRAARAGALLARRAGDPAAGNGFVSADRAAGRLRRAAVRDHRDDHEKTDRDRDRPFAIMFWMNLMQFPLNLAGSDPMFIFRIDASMILPLTGVAVAGSRRYTIA